MRGCFFNIGMGKHVRVDPLWASIAAMAGTTVSPVFENSRPGDIIESVADIHKAGSQLGFKPRYSFQEGLQKTFNWYCGGKTNDI